MSWHATVLLASLFHGGVMLLINLKIAKLKKKKKMKINFAFLIVMGITLVCSTVVLSRMSCRRLAIRDSIPRPGILFNTKTDIKHKKNIVNIFNGVLPTGNDVGGERYLSVQEAISACGSMNECKGFTFSGEANIKGRTRIFFKSVYKPVPTQGWTSYQVHPAMPGYNKYLEIADSILASFDLRPVLENDSESLEESFPEYPIENLIEKPWFSYMKPSESQIMVSYAPRAFLLPNFIDDDLAKDIRDHGERALQRSQVAKVPANKTVAAVSNVRTSFGSWLTDDIASVKELRDRIEKSTGVKRSNFEALQILRYQKDQQYVPHVDYFHPRAYGPQDFNRMATVIVYLTPTAHGGETVFPYAHGFTPNTSAKCSGGLRLKPVKNTAMIFYSMMPDGNFDPWALHGGCPVLGDHDEKWVAVQWLRVQYPEGGLPPQSR